MRVAFYFSNDRLGVWGWEDFVRGRVPASGTDGQFLGLVHRMAGRSDMEAIGLFGARFPLDAPGGSQLVSDLSGAVQVAKDMACDCIVFNNRGVAESLSGLAQCHEVGLPAIVWDQNGPFPDTRDAFYSAQALKRLVVVSHSQADTLRGHPLFAKTVVIYNSLLFESGHESRDALRGERVCFVGATIAQKGFHHLARAWPEVRCSRPEAELVILGSAQLYDRERALGPLGLGDPQFERDRIIPYWGDSREGLDAQGIKIQGLVAPALMGEILRDCAVAVVNPCCRDGSYETFCVSAIEAQAAGCPAVGGRRLGLRETVRHGETGILIRRESDLAGAIIGLLCAPEKAAAMGASGARWVREAFSTERADAKWMALFRDVIEGRPNRPPRFQWRLATPGSMAREMMRLGRLARTRVRMPFGVR